MPLPLPIHIKSARRQFMSSPANPRPVHMEEMDILEDAVAPINEEAVAGFKITVDHQADEEGSVKTVVVEVLLVRSEVVVDHLSQLVHDRT
jgi:hypothetical protein